MLLRSSPPHNYAACYWFLESLNQRFSKCDPQASSSSIAWDGAGRKITPPKMSSFLSVGPGHITWQGGIKLAHEMKTNQLPYHEEIIQLSPVYSQGPLTRKEELRSAEMASRERYTQVLLALKMGEGQWAQMLAASGSSSLPTTLPTP